MIAGLRCGAGWITLDGLGNEYRGGGVGRVCLCVLEKGIV